jgi:hypothetical protein
MQLLGEKVQLIRFTMCSATVVREEAEQQQNVASDPKALAMATVLNAGLFLACEV